MALRPKHSVPRKTTSSKTASAAHQACIRAILDERGRRGPKTVRGCMRSKGYAQRIVVVRHGRFTRRKAIYIARRRR